VFHAHDWQAGLVPVYLKSFYWDDPALYRSPSVFTIHNLAYQGTFGGDTLDVLGLPWHFASGEAMGHQGGISYMKGGIQFSEMVTTVSPQYAREIQGAEMGYGLDGTLRGRAADLVGILNGVDYGEWDPRHDKHIAAPYSADDLAGKESASATCCGHGLPAEPDLPIVGIISRLVRRKGSTSSCDAWYDLLQRPMRMVVLGHGRAAAGAGLRRSAERAPDRFAVRLDYDEGLAHKIEAGADIFLMPSRVRALRPDPDVQPALRHRPVVRVDGRAVRHGRAVGSRDGTGHRLPLRQPGRHRADVGAGRALKTLRTARPWEQIVRNGMEKDFSWDRSAEGLRRGLPARHGEDLIVTAAGVTEWNSPGIGVRYTGWRTDRNRRDPWPKRSRPSPTRTGTRTS
jgi:starch synthase